MAFQFPSILIPHVWENISPDYVSQIITKLNIGITGRVDVVPRDISNGGKPSNMMFIHMREWFTNTAAQNLRNKILRGEEGRIVYDDPWHWVIVQARNPRLDTIRHEVSVPYNQRVHDLHNSIDHFVNQAHAQGHMIHSLNTDLNRANQYIRTLEEKVYRSHQTNVSNTEKTKESTRFIPHLSGDNFDNRSIQWASGHFLMNEIPMDLIAAEEGEDVSVTVDGEIYTSKFDYIAKNITEAWDWGRDHPKELYNEHISTLAWSFRQACKEYTRTKEQSLEVKSKVHFSPEAPAEITSSPTQLPTPSGGMMSPRHNATTFHKGKHQIEALTIDTDFKSVEYNDKTIDYDIDCGDFASMARRGVSEEISAIRQQRIIESHNSSNL